MIFGGNRDELAKYVREIADLGGLRDWGLMLANEPASEEYAADINVAYGCKYATIRVAADWAQQSPESIRSTVAHELLHCHLKPTEWAFNNVQAGLWRAGGRLHRRTGSGDRRDRDGVGRGVAVTDPGRTGGSVTEPMTTCDRQPPRLVPRDHDEAKWLALLIRQGLKLIVAGM